LCHPIRSRYTAAIADIIRSEVMVETSEHTIPDVKLRSTKRLRRSTQPEAPHRALRTGTGVSKLCSTQKVTTTAKAKRQPVHEIRLGAIKAAIRENQTTAGARHNVTVCRVYKDGDECKQTEMLRA